MEMDITSEHFKKREGTWNVLKRTLGFQVKSVLEILITPAAALPPPKIAPPIQAAAAGGGQAAAEANAKARLTQPAVGKKPPMPAGGASPAVSAFAALTHDDPHSRLSNALPPNVILPSGGAAVVGIYRVLLKQMCKITVDAPERQLPQVPLYKQSASPQTARCCHDTTRHQDTSEPLSLNYGSNLTTMYMTPPQFQEHVLHLFALAVHHVFYIYIYIVCDGSCCMSETLPPNHYLSIAFTHHPIHQH